MRYPTTDNLTCVICGESALEMLGFDINFNKVTKKDSISVLKVLEKQTNF